MLRYHFIVATIHTGMGQNLPALVTFATGDDMYHLFQCNQVLVLLSRTHYAKDIIFVGNPGEMIEARVWWRFEFQDSVGNLPHIHALIWLQNGEPLNVTHNRIRRYIMEVIRPEEIRRAQE